MAGAMLKSEIKGDSLTEFQERHNLLIYHENHIRKELQRLRESFVYIGYHLMDIEDKQLYKVVYYQASGNYCENVFQYAAQELEIKKSTAYNLMAVAREFSDERRGLKEEFKDYTFSQLVELLTVPAEALRYASPYMTIKQLRQWKKGEKVGCAGKDNIYCNFQIPAEIQEKFQTSGKANEYETPDIPRQVNLELPKKFQTYGKSVESVVFENGGLAVSVKSLKDRQTVLAQEMYDYMQKIRDILLVRKRIKGCEMTAEEFYYYMDEFAKTHGLQVKASV